MAIRKLKNGGRRKAPFGSQESAILGAALIGAGAQASAAAVGAAATKEGAERSAKATIQGAKDEAKAIKDQNTAAKELQEQSQQVLKEENAQNRELQNQIQMTLQMMAGQQNINDRLEASKIKVKNGGSTKRKLRLAGKSLSLLRGSENMPFVVTDGGTVIPIGQTPEGYDMYEILGNDHEHYHKAQGGKNKTGVGIKFADGNIIEGEGNQNSNQGEIMVNTPDNAYFISKHSIAGFNPAKMTLGGMHPLQAYAIQEQLKAANGISDDGKHNSTPVKKYMGGMPNNFINSIYATGPQVGVDTIGDTAVGVASQFTDEKRTLKCGGKTRHKAEKGTGKKLFDWNTGTYISDTPKEDIVVPYAPGQQPSGSTTGGTTQKQSFLRGAGNWIGNNADLVGAGAGALGNTLGTIFTVNGNNEGSRIVADAQHQAAGIMRNAYNSLTGIDMNSIRREDYAAAHMMPALRAVVSHSAQPLSQVDRRLQRTLANAGRYSTSGAAMQDRSSKAEVDAQDARNQIHNVDEQQKQETRNENIKSINEAGRVNAMLDSEANKQYAGAYLQGLMYNNINNQKILGAAGAMSEGAINAANAISQAQTSNAAAWASALTGSSQGFANSLSNMITRKNDLAKVMLGASGDSQASYYANPRLASRREADTEYNRLLSQYNAIKDSKKAEDRDTITMLRRRINNIASGRGFRMV